MASDNLSNSCHAETAPAIAVLVIVQSVHELPLSLSLAASSVRLQLQTEAGNSACPYDWMQRRHLIPGEQHSCLWISQIRDTMFASLGPGELVHRRRYSLLS